jgi:D-arabinose 1-dehydrogenase-like Zn-dependent alcohol dehydrogenase
MIDFRARDNFVADVEVTQIKKINEAHERMLKCGISIALFIDFSMLK